MKNQIYVSVTGIGAVPLIGIDGGVDSEGRRVASGISVKTISKTLLAPWSSQPTTTAAAAADTLLKAGINGDQQFTRLDMQNNSTINFIFSIDADSTISTTNVFILAPGQFISYDEISGLVLHCHTASPINFGGVAGITIEFYV